MKEKTSDELWAHYLEMLQEYIEQVSTLDKVSSVTTKNLRLTLDAYIEKKIDNKLAHLQPGHRI
jgi:hypothetical protein